MPMISAERQTRYRQRLKDRTAGGLAAAIERVRQEAMAHWIKQLAEDYSEADSDVRERELDFMRHIADRPFWHREVFAASQLLCRQIRELGLDQAGMADGEGEVEALAPVVLAHGIGKKEACDRLYPGGGWFRHEKPSD